MSEASNRDVEVFAAALQLPADQRAAYLKRACGRDDALLRRVEALLEAHRQAGDFLEEDPLTPAGEGRPRASVGEKPGDRIGRYHLLQQIGEGGCGVVFMAEQQEPVRRRVALKIIKPGMDTRSVIARFEAERQALALMDHPNIAKVLDAGATDSGRPYFVMELIRGVRITEYCDQNALTTEERLRLFVPVCQAVQHAHQKGVIHRDIKPSNILVTTTMEGDALPVVIDFGIAKATTNQPLTDKTVFTAFEMLIGTPAYMSPEQAALTHGDVDTRTDIYSLGVLLYELLTGSTPFDTGHLLRAGFDEIRRVIREEEPARPSRRLSTMAAPALTTVARSHRSEPPALIRAVRGDLDWIAMKALEKDRTRRYETANGLALDVKRFLANETISARPPSSLYRFRKLVRRNRALFAGIGVVSTLLVVSLVLVSAALSGERRARLQEAAALRQAEAEKALAVTAATKSRQVTQFLEEMLQSVGPSVPLGRDTTMVREILDQSARRLGNEGTNPPAVEAELRGLIGRLYLEIGVYGRSEEMHRSALPLVTNLFGRESPEAAASLNDLGLALWRERKLAESEQAHREALRIRRQLFGDVHPDVAASLDHLGNVYRRLRRLDEAEALTREALKIRRTVFGDEHLEVADSLRNLSIILGDQGKRAESEATARQMLAIRRRLLGNEHALVASALADVAWAAGFTGKSDEAESLEGEALSIQRKLLGDEHPDVAKTLGSLGERMRQRGKLGEAHAVLTAALSIQRKLLGDDHPTSLDSLRSLAWTLEGEGHLPDAETAFRQGWQLRRQHADPENPPALAEAEGLVRVLMGQAKFEDTEIVLREALSPSVLRLPASANLQAQRVDLLGRQARWPEAATHAAVLLEQQPTEHYRYHTLAPLLVTTRQRDAYESLCRRILASFADTVNPYVAERMAMDCLLLPDHGLDLRQVGQLADKAVTLESGNDPMPYSKAVKALSEYRQGRHATAVEWARKPLDHPEIYARSQACAVLSMAHWRLGQPEEARAALAQGESLSRSVAPGRHADRIKGSWVAWLIARILLDEASALIQPASASD